MKTYKIRNSNGLYSKGGLSGRWTKKGKTWSSIQYLKCHLSLYRMYSEAAIPEDWIVEEYTYAPNTICELVEYKANALV